MHSVKAALSQDTHVIPFSEQSNMSNPESKRRPYSDVDTTHREFTTLTRCDAVIEFKSFIRGDAGRVFNGTRFKIFRNIVNHYESERASAVVGDMKGNPSRLGKRSDLLMDSFSG